MEGEISPIKLLKCLKTSVCKKFLCGALVDQKIKAQQVVPNAGKRSRKNFIIFPLKRRRGT